jgi:hypothetical protein
MCSEYKPVLPRLSHLIRSGDEDEEDVDDQDKCEEVYMETRKEEGGLAN